MFWVDAALKGFSVIFTVIATLRAGSRAVYLIDHDAIGIMDGPAIERPTGNESSIVYELSEAFRHCMRLSMAPHLYDKVKFQQPVNAVVEPYPLSVQAYLDSKLLASSDKVEDSETKEMFSGGKFRKYQHVAALANESLLEPDGIASEALNSTMTAESLSSSPPLGRRLAWALNPLNGAKVLLDLLPPMIKQSQQCLSVTIEQSQEYLKATPDLFKVTPKLAKYYIKNAMQKKEMEGDSDTGDSSECQFLIHIYIYIYILSVCQGSHVETQLLSFFNFFRLGSQFFNQSRNPVQIWWQVTSG
jgi:hypothetical protein